LGLTSFSFQHLGGNMADSSKVLPILLIGGAGYFVYKWMATPSSATPTTPGTAGTAGTATPAAAPASPPQSSYNSLDATYQRLAAMVAANGPTDPALSQVQGQWTAKSADVFNYYLGKVSQYNLDANGMAAAFGPSAPLTLGQFWSGASNWLAQNKGLTGIGGKGLAGIIASRGGRR
jgi:hypothetical protein